MSRTAIIAAKDIPKSVWDKASAWAAYTKNRIPHKTLQGKTLIEVLLEKDPIKARTNLRPFGQKVICFDYEIKPCDKLGTRSWEERIIGYTQTFGTYQVLTPDGAYKITKNPVQITPTQEDTESENRENEKEKSNPETAGEMHGEASQNNHEQTEMTTLEQPMPNPPPAPRTKQRTAAEWEEKVGFRKSTRERKPNPRIFAIESDPDHHTDEQARSFPDAKKWAQARRRERTQLEKYGVFTKVNKSSIPEGTKIVDTQWVYVVKRNSAWEVEKYKARKVGRGFTEIEGINYDETYAQMMRSETLKILFVIALHQSWILKQWDVVAAYLQAELHHDVYISDINKEGQVEYWKLNKALYGLKQAGHEWYKTLEKILQAAGIIQCIGDEGTYASTNGEFLIGTHVDDLLGIASSEKELGRVEQFIVKHVELEKRGQPTQMLRMELTWGQESVTLTQKLLIESMMKTHLPSDVPGKSGKKTSLPLDPELFKKSESTEERIENPKEYQAIIGGLLFVNRMTRAEISIQVNLLGRRSSSPSAQNLKAAMDTLRYLWSTRFDGIILRKPRDLKLTAYAATSYGGPKARSQTGVLLTLGEQPIGWYSRRQDIVALSITEAEYIADCEGAKDLAWGQQLLSEFHINCQPRLTTDSEGAYDLAKTAKFQRRSRHIEHRFHYLRKAVRWGSIEMTTIPGKNNPADHLTKLLPMSSIKAWKERWMASAGTG